MGCETDSGMMKAGRKEALVREELKHLWGDPLEKFLQSIDDTGGWPLGYTHVSFFHDGPCGDRYCQFTTRHLQTGWWTTVATADDYYFWKLSDAKKAAILKDARKQLIRQLS